MSVSEIPKPILLNEKQLYVLRRQNLTRILREKRAVIK